MKTIRKILPFMLILTLLAGMFTVAFAEDRYVTTGKCNFRTEPSKSGKILTTLKKDVIFTATDSAADDRGTIWIACEINGEAGWVSTQNLRLCGSTDAANENGETAMITAADCHIRAEANLDGADLGVLKKGTEFTATAAEDDDRGVRWYYTEIDGTCGWVSEKNLALCEKEESEADAESTGNVIVPMTAALDLEALDDGTYRVSFENDALSEDASVLSNVTFYTEEVFDIVDIAKMQEGDTIVVEGEPVVISDLKALDGCYTINESFSLVTRPDSNGWFYFGDDDICSYTNQGSVSLPVSDAVVYEDSSDLSATVTADKSTLADTIGNAMGSYNVYNTEITIENGEIVAINRYYMP